MFGYFLQPHNFFVLSPNEAVLKRICADFKGLPNGANFILIDHCVGELLSINKVSSEREHTIVAWSQDYNITCVITWCSSGLIAELRLMGDCFIRVICLIFIYYILVVSRLCQHH